MPGTHAKHCETCGAIMPYTPGQAALCPLWREHKKIREAQARARQERVDNIFPGGIPHSAETFD